MRISKKTIIIVLTILVLAIAALWLASVAIDKVKNSDEVSVLILDVKNPGNEFTVTKADDAYKVFFENGIWRVDNPNIYLNEEYVNAVLKTASGLYATPIEENAPDFSKYGLSKPSATFEFKNNDNMHTIKFGIQAPTGKGYYAVVDDSRDVYLVSNDDYNRLTGGINNLRNKTVLTINPDDVYGVTIKNPDNTIVIQPKESMNENAHSGTIWEMTEPYLMDVNQYIFEENIVNVLDFTVSEFVDDNPTDYSVYGLDNPKYTIEVFTYDTSFTIFFGNDKDAESVYMMVDGYPNVFSIDKKLVEYKDFTPVYLMESLVFSRFIFNVDNIVFNYGEQYVMKIDGEKFYMNDKQVDEDAFRGTYYELIASIIAGEVKSENVGNEICNFTFNYNNGTPSETVVFYEYGEMYSAVSVNGTTEFYILRSHVDKIINEVKKLAE